MRDESFHEICKASVAALGKFMMMVFSVMLSMFGSFIAGVLRAEEPIHLGSNSPAAAIANWMSTGECAAAQ